VCAFKTVEPCVSFEYHRSKDKNERGLRLRRAKCLHLYKYFLHPVFGFMNVRLQTWFPFDIQVCLNGREWLARQLARRRCDFKRIDNCFPWIEDVDLAQRLMDKQLETDWPEALRRIARSVNPLHDQIFRWSPMDYDWVAHQTRVGHGHQVHLPSRARRHLPGARSARHEPLRQSRRHAPPRQEGARQLHRRAGHLLQGPARRRSGQALGRRQLDQDVRQGWLHPTGGDHHRGDPTVQGPAPAR